MKSDNLLVLAAFCLALSRVEAQGIGSSSSIVLRPGDMVRITVWRKPELSAEMLVAADSSLKNPLYQEVKIAGLPLPDAQARIQAFLKRYEAAPLVSLEPLFRVAVGGEVRNPNLYSLAPETSVSQAVSLAGGPTDRGRLDRVRVLRGGNEILLDLLAPGGDGVQMPIASGDRVFVLKRSDRLRDFFIPFFTVVGSLAAVTNIFLARR